MNGIDKTLFGEAEKLKQVIESTVVNNAEELESFRIEFLGSKGKIKALFGKFKEVSTEKKKEFGQVTNLVKKTAEDKFNQLKENLETSPSKGSTLDVSAPGFSFSVGSIHPITTVKEQIIEVFTKIGFVVEDGPEIEDDWHNFTALNILEDHPARDMQDTFFVSRSPDYVLRTHTSNVQIRTMETQKPPIRIICPGRVYRNETIDAGHHVAFHQVEGLYIAERVSLADLKQTLQYFIQEIFGVDAKMRLRPSYFPFTEPSAEVDMSCMVCGGEGCSVCKQTGWVEIMGCGMVDPQVLKNCNIDSNKYSGFAFGMGVERITMLKYKIKDIRLFFENDVRFLNQFVSE